MKRFLVISTYPNSGSKNIGDQLITDCLSAAIKDTCAESSIETVWRAAPWEELKDKVQKADHVFFACLAIRPLMHANEYPTLKQIIENAAAFSVIAAGTDFPVHKAGDTFGNFSPETLNLLADASKHASTFTTRGVLTQEFCSRLGIENAEMRGDIAFYGQEYFGRSFVRNRKVRTVVISDPHKPVAYLRSFHALCEGITDVFSDAKILVALHGINSTIESYCVREGIEFVRIYDRPHDGLAIYDSADLHVGFRVHAHVSALKRRVYSYLLEQDGRGCDYGLTLERKISVPNYLSPGLVKTERRFLGLCQAFVQAPPIASICAVDQIVALIRHDLFQGFEKFQGLENQLDFFHQGNQSVLQDVLRVT